MVAQTYAVLLRALGQPYERDYGMVEAWMFQKFAIAYGDTNPLYFDADYARRLGYRDVLAPPTFLIAQNGMGASLPEPELRHDGLYPRNEDKGLPTGVRVMAGGVSLTIYADVFPHDHIVCSTKVLEVVQKPGKKGSLIFVTSERSFSNLHEVVQVCRETRIYR